MFGDTSTIKYCAKSIFVDICLDYRYLKKWWMDFWYWTPVILWYPGRLYGVCVYIILIDSFESIEWYPFLSILWNFYLNRTTNTWFWWTFVETACERCSTSIISLVSNLFFNYLHKFFNQFWFQFGLDQFSWCAFRIESSWEHFHRENLSCQLNLCVSRAVKCRYRFTRQIIKRSRKLLT